MAEGETAIVGRLQAHLGAVLVSTVCELLGQVLAKGPGTPTEAGAIQ